MMTIEALLAAQPVFEGLRADHVAALASCARSHDRVAPGTILFHEGRPADRFHVLGDGAVALSVHAPHRGQLPLETIHGPDVVGFSWLIEPHEWQSEAVVIEDAEIVTIDGRALIGRCEDDTELGWELARRFVAVVHRRLTASRLRLLDLYGRTDGGRSD